MNKTKIREICAVIKKDILNRDFEAAQRKLKMVGNNVSKMSLNELRALLAYEMWSDGAPDDFVEDLRTGRDNQYKKENDYISELKSKFGYK